ncbi:MAG: DUF2059 domain-containing protein [Bradyrhizobiaceae bacterium]|nr:DUF2059 domain-containing protein [Bradyrhizobiaceae bacterium]
MGGSRGDFGRKAGIIPAMVLVVVAGFATAGLGAEKPDSRLPELIKLVGLDTAFDQTGAIIKASLKQAAAGQNNGGNAVEKFLAAADPAADVAFQPAALQREFLHNMEGRLTNADLDAIFAFFKAPLGARMTALENAKIREAPDAAMKKAGELAELIKREPARAEVLKDLDSALKLTETSTEQTISVSRAVAIGMAAADENTKDLSAEVIARIDAGVATMRPTLTARIKEVSALSLTYTYREASVSELRQYVKFLKSPAGRKLYGTVVPALGAVLIKAGTGFGHAIMRELGKERA